jgi:hexosaminidase
MIAVIPLPARLEPVPGEPLDPGRGIRVGNVAESVRPIIDTFAADLAGDSVTWYRPDATDSAPLDIALRDATDPQDESYYLKISEHGGSVRAETTAGVYRALTTVRQILNTVGADRAEPRIGPLEVSDSPRYRWRGLSFDVARSFFDVAQVKRVVDVLAFYKFNVLHLHLTDDQGWRIEIPSLPRLTEIGGQRAFRDHPAGYYSTDDFAEIVGYAAARFITVVPEIDMPGHAAAAIAAYPHLAPPDAPQDRPSNLLDPDGPGVMEFVRAVLTELAGQSPGPYLHIGGDEAFGMPADAYRRFVEQARGIVRALGKTPVTWQEAAETDLAPGDPLQHWLAFDPAIEQALTTGEVGEVSLPEGFEIPVDLLPQIVESMRTSRAALTGAIERGARVILSPASHLYLDRPYLEHSINAEQNRLRDEVGLSLYPRASVSDAFGWDPGAALADLADPAASVLGVEATVWSETIATREELEFMLLPRLAGVAERAWSGPPISVWDEYKVRLSRHAAAWDRRGWGYFASDLVPWDG